MKPQPTGFLVQVLRDGLASLTDAPLAHLMARGDAGAGRLAPVGLPPGTLLPAQDCAYRACTGEGLWLVWGPPGTGKTTVLKRAISDLVARGKRVLLVSATNIAVDNALWGVVKERRHGCGSRPTRPSQAPCAGGNAETSCGGRPGVPCGAGTPSSRRVRLLGVGPWSFPVLGWCGKPDPSSPVITAAHLYRAGFRSGLCAERSQLHRRLPCPPLRAPVGHGCEVRFNLRKNLSTLITSGMPRGVPRSGRRS
ncbi:AAA domain-containing protein [Streptomyces sp. NPDC051664]|uniref:AAA domain-containing protein n=1 Tax=Streptomyces sp. NPDC051664 TaxID=3365668 RepID=UPI003792280F